MCFEKRELADVTAAILAGGLGTRLRAVVNDRPKVLAPVLDRPYGAYLLDRLAASGLRQVVLLTGHLADQVQRAFGERHRGMRLVYSPEPEPLGTAGALRQALRYLKSSVVLVMNGDSWCDMDLTDFLAFHQRQDASISLALSRQSDSRRYGRVRVTADGQVTGWDEKSGTGAGWINAGVYFLERRLVEEIPPGIAASLERELLPKWLRRGERVRGFFCSERFIDIGTPESYAAAEQFFRVGA